MDPALVFTICNNAVLPFWLLLVVAPKWRWSQKLVHSALAPAALAVVYLAFIATGETPEGGGLGSLAGIIAAFNVPEIALAGWIHYLAFDLFVGAWESRDAQRRGIPHLAVIPCMVLTLMLGPVGLALYLGIRAVMQRTGTLVEAPVPEAAPA